MSNDFTIYCNKHGQSPGCMMCRHLREESGLQYYSQLAFPEVNPSVRMAWCNKCHTVLTRESGWSPEAKTFADMKIVCTPCYDQTLERHTSFLLELVAYHEAGHAVVGLGLGLTLSEAAIHRDGTGFTYWGEENGQSLSDYQRQLVGVVAGPVSDLLLAEEKFGPSERRHPFPTDPAFRLPSWRIRYDQLEPEDEVDDANQAQYYAWAIVQMGKMGVKKLSHMRLAKSLYALNGQAWPSVDADELVSEVIRAERWAERLLRRRWGSVKSVAGVLQTSDSHKLTGAEVQHILVA